MTTLLVNDVDSHENIPGHLLSESFGEPGRMLGDLFESASRAHPDPTPTNPHQPGVSGDVSAVDPETIWSVKGAPAPSAIDLNRRAEVLEVMGIDRQLVFPTAALGALIIGGMTDDAYAARWGADTSMFGNLSRPEFAEQFVIEHNRWAMANASLENGRIRAVGVLRTRANADEMIAQARQLVEGGVRAVYLQADVPPGGMSPANSAFDPMWALLEEANIAVTLHIGTEFFFLDPGWTYAETFSAMFQSAEIPNANLQVFSTVHMAIDNYLSTLVLGGVFERFPRLRVGLMEVGAHWVGNAARRMNMYVDVFPGADAKKFSLKPSEFIARNVRVSPFNFEPVERYFQDDPDLADVFCYSTDYPHTEGGKDSKARMLARLEPLGEEIVTKFFRTNAELLLPD